MLRPKQATEAVQIYTSSQADINTIVSTYAVEEDGYSLCVDAEKSSCHAEREGLSRPYSSVKRFIMIRRFIESSGFIGSLFLNWLNCEGISGSPY